MKIIFVCCIAGLCMACTPRAVREARGVVAQADSLWHAGQMYGVDAGDSATLAQAYETLGAIPLPFREGLGLGSSYARSCYHYGRLLRAKEDPVAAMQVFIAATHSHTRDYHILGRVYSNMGSICHLAGEFPLSYDMYEKSANMFLLNGDSLLYYYLLNDMAFELASSKDIDSSLTIIENITCNHIEDYTLLAYCSLTRSRAYYEIQNYDSAIYYAHHPYLAGESAATLLLAQSYSHLGNRDSSVHYAEMVLKENPTLEESNNALYIVTNEGFSKDLQTILKKAGDRSDIQKELEIRQGKLAQATQILEQDLNRRYDWTWLIAIVGTIIITALVIIIYRRSQRKKHNLLSQKVEDLSNAYSDIQSNKLANIERVSETLRTSPAFTKDICWRDYNKMCTIADNHFYLLTTKLKQKKILNEQEIRLCILVLINYNNHGISQILSYAPSGVGKLKYRVAQKLGIESKNLRKYLLSIAIDEPFAP